MQACAGLPVRPYFHLVPTPSWKPHSLPVVETPTPQAVSPPAPSDLNYSATAA